MKGAPLIVRDISGKRTGEPAAGHLKKDVAVPPARSAFRRVAGFPSKKDLDGRRGEVMDQQGGADAVGDPAAEPPFQISPAFVVGRRRDVLLPMPGAHREQLVAAIADEDGADPVALRLPASSLIMQGHPIAPQGQQIGDVIRLEIGILPGQAAEAPIIALVDPLNPGVNEIVPEILDEIVGRTVEDIARIILPRREIGGQKRIGFGLAKVLIAPVEKDARDLEHRHAPVLPRLEAGIGVEMMLGVVLCRPRVGVISFDVELDKLGVKVPPLEGRCDSLVRLAEIDPGASVERFPLVEDTDDAAEGVSKCPFNIPGRCLRLGQARRRPSGLLDFTHGIFRLSSGSGNENVATCCARPARNAALSKLRAGLRLAPGTISCLVNDFHRRPICGASPRSANDRECLVSDAARPRVGAQLVELVFISSNSVWGGSEDLWSETAAVLASRGHRVTVYKNRLDVQDGNIARLRALSVRLVELARPPFLPRRVCDWLEDNAPPLAVAYQMRRLRFGLQVRARPALAIISQGGNHDGWRFADICHRLGLPFVLVCQKATDLYWPDDESLPYIRSVFREALHCFFVARHNLRRTEEQIGAAIHNGSVVRNPFKVSWDTPQAWPAADLEWRLACVARLEPMEKGQDLLLRVLAAEKWRRRAVSVTFFGVGPQETGVRAMADFLDLKNVSFAGFVEDIPGIWADHHALVLPSRCEGLPLALVEAMLSGRVAIVMDVAGNPEVVEDGTTGFLIGAPTEEALDEAMERAWERRGEWCAIGERAALAIRELVPPNPASAFADRLLELIADNARRSRELA